MKRNVKSNVKTSVKSNVGPRSTRLLTLFFTLVFTPLAISSAQCTPGGPPSPVAIKGMIGGVVMDTSHNVLEGVDVLLRTPQRTVKSDARGRFFIPDLEKGVVELTVRKAGYEIAMQKIAVTDSGGIARFCLIPEVRGLPAMITSVSRGGLSGVIGDSAYNTLAGAEVRAVGANAHAITDSAGGFFIDLKTGSHLITVKKKGYGTQVIGVSIPADSGRQIAVWLGSPARNAARMAVALDDMRSRLLMSKAGGAFDAPGSPNRARLISSEDLAKMGGTDLTAAVQRVSTRQILPDCEAIIDGGPYSLPFSLIDKADIAAMEVYMKAQKRYAPGSLDPRGTIAPVDESSPCPVTVFVWLKP